MERVLGQGGMGQVLAAYDTLRGRRVALKRMRSDRPGDVRRLKEEFRALSDLAHLNLCALYDIHEVDGQLYLAMEYIEGTDLRSWCRPATTHLVVTPPEGDRAAPPSGDDPARTRGTQGGAEHLHGAEETYAFEDPPAVGGSPPVDDPARTRGTQGGAEHLRGADETYALDDPPVAGPGVPSQHRAALGPTLAVDNETVDLAGATVEDTDAPPAAATQPDHGADAPDLSRIRASWLQLVDALEVLHASGRVHRDLKPANVMVTPEGRVVVLDFGLTTAKESDPLDGRGARRARIEGTPAYMAPERFRASNDGPAVDWFALGVMLYDALVDALPFASIDQIRALRPELIPDPRDTRPDVPEGLALLCVALLHPDPARRAGAAEVRAAFGAERTRALPPPFRARRLVGRQAAFSSLDDGVREARRGVDALVHVVGRSGYGKSSLLAAFLRDLREHDEDFVLVGRCYERESVPYRMFDGIVETLSDLLRTHQGKRTTEEEVSAIHRLFPSLDTTLVQGERTTNPFGLAATGTLSTTPGTSQGHVIEVAVHALGRVLAELAGARPVVMVIDDVQWGDHDSLHVLEELLATVERPPLLVVLASREEEAENPLVRGLDRVLEAHAEVGFDRTADLRRPASFRRVHVGPLTRDDVAAIVAELPAQEGGRGGAPVSVDALLADTGGSPLLVQELATLRAAGFLQPGEGLDAAIRLRTESLPEHARALFTTICVAGHPLQQDDAWRASVDGFAREEAVHALRVAGLVRTHGGSPLDPVEPAHDRVRETVARGTPAERRREVHARLAAVLDANPRVDPAIRAAHWRDGGDFPRAVVLARRAAMQAERSGAWDRVAEMLGLVEACANLQGADRTALRVRRARALRAAGHCEAAAHAFLAVAEELTGVERADARLDAVEQYLVGGYHDEGLAQAQAMLGEVGLGIPEGPVSLVAALGVERARLFFCRFDAPAGRPATLSPDDHVRLRASWSMATGLSIVDSRLAAVFSARYVRYALAARDPDAIAQGFALEAGHLASTGDHAAARDLLARAEEVVRRCNDSHTPAFVQLLSGFVHYFGGNWRDAVNAYDGALAHFSATQRGASWAVSTAHLFGVWARLYAGDWRELQRRAVQLRREAMTGTNRYLGHGYHIGSGVITALLTDRPEDAARSIVSAMEGWHDKAFQIQHFLALFMGGWVDLYVGTPAETRRKMHAAWPQIQRSLLLQVADVRFRLHHMRGFTCVAVGGAVHATEALMCAGVIEGVQARGAAPTAGLIRAAVAFQRGDAAAASARLEDALVAFQEAEMPAFAAAASWRLGQLAGAAGAPRCEQARHALAALGVVRPERMLEVLAPGFDVAGVGPAGVEASAAGDPHVTEGRAGAVAAPQADRGGRPAAEPVEGREAERYAALSANILFSGVRRHELLELVRELKEGSDPAGTLLMRVGDLADRLILVEEGEVQVETADQVVVRRLGPGSIVGEWGVLLRQPRTATVRAATPVRYVSLTAEAVANYLSADQGRALAFLRGARGILSVVERSNAELGEALARSDRMRAEQAELLRLGVATIACLSGYTLLLDLIRYADNGLPTYTWLNVPITLGFGGVVAWLIHKSPSPRSAFGLTMEGAGRAVKEGVLVACALASLVLVARWIPATRDLVEPVPLVVQLAQGTLPSPGSWWATLLLYTLVIAPTQEFIVRGVLQNSLERLSKDQRGPWIANIVANLVFATTHLVYSHTVVAAVYVFGTLMGLLARRHASLLAVVVAHSLAGALILWILGLPGVR